MDKRVELQGGKSMKLNYKSRNLALVVLTLILAVSLVLVACNEINDVTINVADLEDTYQIGDSVRIIAVLSDGSEYVVSVDDKYSDIVKVDGTKVTVIGDVSESKTIEIKITSKANSSISKTINMTVVPSTSTGNISITSDSYTIDIGKSVELKTNPSGAWDIQYSLDGATFSDTCEYLNYSKTTGKLSLATSPATDTVVIVKLYSKEDSSLYGTKEYTVKGLVSIDLSIDSDKLQQNSETLPASATLTANVTGNAEIVVSCVSELVKITDNADGTYKVALTQAVKFTQNVIITASLVSNPDVTAKLTLTLVQTRSDNAPVSSDKGITLTQDNLAAIGNASITVAGSLHDKVQTTATNRIDTQSYDMKVIMEQDKWYGQWNVAGRKLVTKDTYVKGTKSATVTAYDYEGNASLLTGSVMDRLYVDIHNKVTSKTVTDYQSIPSVWELQHLWNHMSDFSVDWFEYDAEFDQDAIQAISDKFVSRDTNDDTLVAFKFKSEAYDLQAAYLFAYLLQSFTPLASTSDTLENLYLICDTEGIVGIYGVTVVAKYWGTEDNTPVDGEEPISTSWTEVALVFSGVGTSTVPTPAAYENTDDETEFQYLVEALNDIKAAKNYSFTALETATRAPSNDEGDYSTESLSLTTASVETRDATALSGNYYNHTSAEGIGADKNGTGTVGYVVADDNTENKFVLLETVGKYSYSLDDKLYHYTYTGYRGFADEQGVYEEFEYDSTTNAFKGSRKINKDISTILPLFDFAPEIFELASFNIDKNDSNIRYYSFDLKDSVITYDVVQQFSLDANRNSASADSANTVQITIKYDRTAKKATIYSTSYPYSFVGGSYAGYITTYYSNIGTTTLDESKVFANYARRVLPNSWDQVNHKGYYYYLHTTTVSKYPGMYDEKKEEYIMDGNQLLVNAKMDTVIENTFGNNKKYLPAPSFFLDIFDDNMHGPWYDYSESDKVTDGYIDSISITLEVMDVDENHVLGNDKYNTIIEQLKAAFDKWNKDNGYTTGGWQYSASMSTATAVSDDDMSIRYAVFVSDGLTICFQNNRNAFFYVDIYTTGEWTR